MEVIQNQTPGYRQQGSSKLGGKIIKSKAPLYRNISELAFQDPTQELSFEDDLQAISFDLQQKRIKNQSNFSNIDPRPSQPHSPLNNSRLKHKDLSSQIYKLTQNQISRARNKSVAYNYSQHGETHSFGVIGNDRNEQHRNAVLKGIIACDELTSINQSSRKVIENYLSEQ